MVTHLNQLFKNPGGRSTGIIFALCGLIFGTWASFIPYVKQKFQLDDGQLGLLLLCMPVGTLIANAMSVLILSHWGAVKTSLIFIVLMSMAFALPILMPSITLVSIGLVLAGATFAFTNVAMNTCASDLEHESGIRLMSACHGMWSVGAMAGALISGFGIAVFKWLTADGSNAYTWYVIVIALFTLWITWWIKGGLWQIHEDWARNKKPPEAGISIFKPNRTLWILISIILCTYLTEGTMADWSAVYLRDCTNAPETIIGWGFGLYAFFMAIGRFMGDSFIARYGNMTVLKIGGQLVILGLIIIIISSSPWLALPGFMLTGLGISIASPILYAAAAKVPDMPPGAGLATMNTFGMAAFLGGPVLVGFIAKASSLRIAFMIVAFFACIWVVQTIFISRNKTTA